MDTSGQAMTQPQHNPKRVGAALLAAVVLAAAPAAAADVAFSVMESGIYDKAAAEIAPAFKAKTGTNVRIMALPWSVLRIANTNDLLTNTHRFSVMSGGYYLTELYSYFTFLDDYIKKDNFAVGMLPGVMQPGRSEWYNGHQIGVPYGIDAFGLIVNRTLLAKAEIAENFPDWPALTKACETIEAKLTGVACISFPTLNAEQLMGLFVSAYTGPYVDASTHYHLDEAKAALAGMRMAQLWKHVAPKIGTLTFDQAHQRFLAQKAVFLMTWPSFVTRALDADESPVKGQWGMTKFPGAGFVWLSIWQLFVPDAAADKALAWQWIKAYAGPESAKANFEKFAINPVWSAVYDDPALKAAHAHYWPAMLDGFARAKNPPLTGDAQELLISTLQDIVTEHTPPSDALKALNAKWQRLPVPPAMLNAARTNGLAEK